MAWLYFRLGAMNELQYRVNFLIQFLQSLIAIGTGLIALWLIFSHTSSLDGWSPYQLLALMGVYTLAGGIIHTVIQPNMEQLMDDVQQGTLDYALTKPVDGQLIVSVRQVSIWQSVDVLTGFLVIGYALPHLGAQLGLLQALAFLLVLVLGTLMIYSFWLMITSLCFWFVNIYEITNLFDGIYAAGRYPVGIYPFWLRFGLTFLVPVAFAVTLPAEVLTGRLNGTTLLGAIALAAVLLVLARVILRLGLRRYSGASA